MRATPYDGRKAVILSGHPHADAVAICLGAECTAIGWALKFKRKDTDEEFFVFKPEEVQWIM